MKLNHFTILFGILFFLCQAFLRQQEEYQKQLEAEKQRLDRCIDSAVDAAAGHLPVYHDGVLRIDKEGALEAFLNNMYAGLGILDHIPAQQKLLSYLPFFIAADEEGYYVWHIILDAEKGLTHCWSAKEFFKDLESVNGASEKMERAKIMEQAVRDAVEKYNWIAKENGLDYVVLMPNLDDCLWLRGQQEPGLLVLIQGMPLQYGGKRYSRFSFAGAVIHKQETAW